MSVCLLLIVMAGVSSGSPLPETPPAAPSKEISKADTEALVRREASAQLGVGAGELRVVVADSRTWPDRRLGCRARRGLEEPARVPGYLFVIEASGQRQTYHTDRAGRILRCDAPGKPLAPIAR